MDAPKPNLLKIATQAMVSQGLEPDFPPDALEQLAGIPPGKGGI
jgi:hypothetical protein